MTSRIDTRTTSPAARRGGYAVSVVVNLVLLYVINVGPGWQQLPFLTDAFADVLVVVNLSMLATLVVNVVQIFYDPQWFVALGQLVLSAIALVVAIRLLEVWPFDFSAYSFNWDALTRVILWIAVVGSIAGMIASVVRIARSTVMTPLER